MSALTVEEVRRQIERFLRAEQTAETLETWLGHETWDVDFDRASAGECLANAAFGLLLEAAALGRDSAQLRREMSALLTQADHSAPPIMPASRPR